MAWVTAADLSLALSPSTYLALFDDGTGTPNVDAVNLVLRGAHADVMRYASRGWDGAVPTVPPDELFILELDFARARAYMRGDSYTRDTGKEIFAAARETGKDIAASLQRGGVDMPNPTPALSLTEDLPFRDTGSPISASDASPGTRSAIWWGWRTEGRR